VNHLEHSSLHELEIIVSPQIIYNFSKKLGNQTNVLAHSDKETCFLNQSTKKKFDWDMFEKWTNIFIQDVRYIRRFILT